MTKSKLSWLDLRRCGLSLLDRLVLEEALLRHDPLHRSWGIIGTHDPTYNRFVDLNHYHQHQNHDQQTFYKKRNCCIVLGIGGKPQNLLNLPLVQRDRPLIVKRFSGGGTVVVDHSSLFTTFIGRTNDFPNVKPYPRDIMQWSAKTIFGPVFQSMNSDLVLAVTTTNAHKYASTAGEATSTTRNIMELKRKSLVLDTKSCGVENSGRVVMVPPLPPADQTTPCSSSTTSNIHTVPHFSLNEHDYVLGERKMGGNAQAIIRGGWLHHTSFLWDYVDEHMEYLTLPHKRPRYRGHRTHDEFLVKLNQFYDSLGGQSYFFDQVKNVVTCSCDVEEVPLSEAIRVVNEELGGMQAWFDGKCRTRPIVV